MECFRYPRRKKNQKIVTIVAQIRKSDAIPIPALAPGDSLQFPFHDSTVIVTVVVTAFPIVVEVGVVVGVAIARVLTVFARVGPLNSGKSEANRQHSEKYDAEVPLEVWKVMTRGSF